MANTFKFGNGNWAVKDGYALAYNDENNNFKPLPFDFTRASTATRVNKQGLVETVPSGKPRIDFFNNTSGHLLLEPQRTNEYPNSNDRTSGGSRTSKTGGTTKFVDGLTDVRAERSVNTGTPYFWNSATITSGNKYAFSIFVRLPDTNPEGINSVRIQGLTTIESFTAKFNLINGTIISSDADSTLIEAFANDWYRLKVTADGISNATNINFAVYPSNDLGETNFTITTTGRDLLFANGFQLEEGSYATSYIPTEGSSVTRVAETTNATVPSGVFGTSGGTIYVEGVVAPPDSSGQMPFTAYGSTTSDLIYIWLITDGRAYVESYTSGSLECNISSSSGLLSVGDSYKIAFAYANNDFVMYVNGTQIGTDTSGSITVPTRLKVANYITTGYASGKIKQTKIYDTRLTNTELQNLTS